MFPLPMLCFCPLLIALQDEAKTLFKPEEGVGLVVPAQGYAVREKGFEWGLPDTRYEIESVDGEIRGALLLGPRRSLSARQSADAREAWLRQGTGVRKIARFREETLSKPLGEWILREVAVDFDRGRRHYLILSATRGSRIAELLLWGDGGSWEGHKSDLRRIATGVVLESVWNCENCTRRVARGEAACASCKTPVYPPHETLAAFSKKNDIQIVTRPSEAFIRSLSPDGSLEIRQAEETVLARYLPILAGELARYPEGFFRGVDLERMVVAADMAADGHEAFGIACDWIATILYRTREGINVQGSERKTVHHEIMHFLDARDDGDIQEEDSEWEKLNPWGFAYDPKKYGKEFFEFQWDLKGFVSRYSMTRVADDKAEIYGWLVTRPQDVLELAKKDKWIAKKIEYVKKMAFLVSPQLDGKWWDSLLQSK